MKLTESSPDHAFEYRVRVQPHHTDYGGVVWHGTYIAWLEEARVEYLRSHGIEFAEWVSSGVDLPVVDLSVQYRQPLTMGMTALLKTWMLPPQGVRIVWQYEIQNAATQSVCALAQVTLVPVSRDLRKVLRRLPKPLQSDLDRLYSQSLDAQAAK